jgi:hypothetical protein
MSSIRRQEQGWWVRRVARRRVRVRVEVRRVRGLVTMRRM